MHLSKVNARAKMIERTASPPRGREGRRGLRGEFVAGRGAAQCRRRARGREKSSLSRRKMKSY